MTPERTLAFPPSVIPDLIGDPVSLIGNNVFNLAKHEEQKNATK